MTEAANRELCFALAGNPNCGKTTLFNQLTGSNQYVGNWPGVTVEKKEGKMRTSEKTVRVLDLPGIYSLSPYSPEEIITRNCLLDQPPDVIINIVDATNLERNLYLTTQLAELGLPMVIALNMVDLLEKRGDKINVQGLEKAIGIPVRPISASHGYGLQELTDCALLCAKQKDSIQIKNIYTADVDMVLSEIEKILHSTGIQQHLRWTAVKLLEEDDTAFLKIPLPPHKNEKMADLKNMLHTTRYVDRAMIIADQRYKYICGICKNTVQKSQTAQPVSPSDRIDRFATHRILAIPLFMLMMAGIFFITFGRFGNTLKDGMEWLIKGKLSGLLLLLLQKAGASDWAQSLLLNGLLGGLGSVLSFLPQIAILFTLLSVLEDSGYMARAAFIMDRPLRKLGLSGRAFVPMLMGFGCTVPAVLGTRTLEHVKDKRLTIFILPFMSCSAKMPVYALFISVFFAEKSPIIIFSVYTLGIIMGLLTALLFKNTILKGKPAPFVMELPPYRMPTPKSLLLHVWERVKDFLTKAGTVLLLATLIIWFLQSFDLQLHMVEDSSYSILAAIGTRIAPLFTLCGFGNWKAAVSLLSGVAAKECVVSTMAILYGGADLAAALPLTFTPLSAYAFMAFVLLYTPCIAALSAIRKEMGSLKWTAVTIGYQMTAAWFVSAMIFQMGTLAQNLFF